MFATQQDRDNFVAQLHTAPDKVKQDIAEQALSSMGDKKQQAQAVASAVAVLPPSGQRQVAKESGWSLPTQPMVDRLWMLIVGALLLLIFFLFAASILYNKQLDDILEFVKSTISLALGAIIGLVSPGAVKSKDN